MRSFVEKNTGQVEDNLKANAQCDDGLTTKQNTYLLVLLTLLIIRQDLTGAEQLIYCFRDVVCCMCLIQKHPETLF